MKILVIGPSWVGDMMMSQSLYRTLQARYPQAIIDVMAPAWCRPLLSRMPEVNEAIPMPLGHGALEIGERRKLGHSLREKRYGRAYVLPNSFKSALVPFFAGIPHRTGWRGEMRYGLLNDVRVLDKEAWPLMVERYIALAYDKGIMRTAQDLPQPLLWPQLQVSEGEKSYTCNQFSLSSERPMIGFCPGAEFGPAKRWPHYHYAELAKQLIEEAGYSGKTHTLYYTMTDQTIVNLLQACQQYWAAVGINVNLQYLDAAGTTALNTSDRIDMLLNGTGMSLDPSLAETGLKTGEMLAYNYSNPRVDELFDLGKQFSEIEDRAPYYQEISKIINEDVARVWLWYDIRDLGFSTKVVGPKEHFEEQHAKTVDSRAFFQIILLSLVKPAVSQGFDLSRGIFLVTENMPVRFMQTVKIIQINNAVHVKKSQLVP